MRHRIALALFLSFALIGGATIFRLKADSKITYTVTTSSADKNANNEFKDFQVAYLDSASENTASSTPLTQTDLIARQMFSDFIDLNSRGRATSENLNSLAKSYADNIVGLSLSFDSGYVPNFETVPNTPANLSAYGYSLMFTRKEHQKMVEENTSSLAPDESLEKILANAATIIKPIYESSVKDLEAMKVPEMLQEEHAALIKNHIASAKAMEALEQMPEDAIQGFSALAAQKKAFNEDVIIFSKIRDILASKGVIIEPGT